MTRQDNPSRRNFVCKLMVSAAFAPLALRPARSANSPAPLLSASDPDAQKVRYTETASQEKTAKGNTCATCSQYEGTYGSSEGPCQLFPNKQVKSAGWCTAWAPQL